MGLRVSSPIFIGRRPELARFDAAFADAEAGHCRVLLISGEAGVGKTRYAMEVARRARASGAIVLEGGCLSVGGEGLPFAPIIEAFRGLSARLEADELDSLLGINRADLARLFPVSTSLQIREPGEPDDGSRQQRLFEHVVAFLSRLAERAPAVVSVDDFHWTDRSTLELFTFLTRNLRERPIVLLATYRSDEPHRGHPLVPLLAELERSGRAERVELHRFNRSELAAQLEAIQGTPPGAQLVDQVMARSQGNAFYAEELLTSGDLTAGLPDTLRDVLLARVGTLTLRAQNVVEVAAADGSLVAHELLATVTGLDEQALERAVREAVDRHVLVAAEGGAGERYAFRHALVQEAVYQQLLPHRRVRLHAAFAAALTNTLLTEPDASRAAEVAYHWQAAGDLPQALGAWIRAGLAAERVYAFAEAGVDFERALALWDQVAEPAAQSPLSRRDVLLHAAQLAAGPNPVRAVARVRAAIDLVDEAIDPTGAGLLYERLGHYSWIVPDSVAAAAAFREAVRLVPAEPDSRARALVLAGLGRYLAMTERPTESVQICREALGVARRIGARDIESRALAPLGLELVLLGDLETGLADIRRALDIAVELGDVYQAASCACGLTEAWLTAGRYDDAARAGLEAETYASRHGLGARWGKLAIFQLTMALDALGRWDEAVAALSRVQRYDLTRFDELQLEWKLLVLEARQGQFMSAGQHAQRVGQLAELIFAWESLPALAELELWQGDPIAARAMLRDAVDTIEVHREVPARWFEWVFVLGIRAESDIAALARSAHQESELAAARDGGLAFYQQMKAVFANPATPRPNPVRDAAWLATASAELSRLEGASDPDQWARAARLWSELLRPFERAYTLMREGEAVLAQRRNRQRAADALNEAHSIAVGLRARPLLEAIEGLATRGRTVLAPGRSARAISQANIPALEGTTAGAEASRRGVRRPHNALTAREREVLALLVAGYSDGEIGERLFISKKTASVHVATIKGKLGARSRVEIATDAIGLGLVEAPLSEHV